MNKLIPTIAALTTALPSVVSAGQYVPMVPLPGVPDGGVTFSTYAPAVFQLVIGVGGILAVIMIVLGGLQLVASGASESQRSSGKDKIWHAIIGLVLIAFIWIVLRLINPNLVNVDISIAPAPAPQVSQAVRSTIAPGTVVDWYDDSQERNELQSLPNNVTINNANCARVGSTRCTSVHGLSSSAIRGLKDLRSSCNCSVVVTGGTEYWLHSSGTAHRVGGSTVDIRDTPDINRYVTGSEATPRNGTRVSRGGATYTYESSGANAANNGHHWHVTY